MIKEVYLKFYRQFIRKYIKEQIVCFIILLLYSATSIIYPSFLKLIIDNAIGERHIDKLFLFILLMILNTLLMAGLKFLQTYKYAQLGQKIVYDIKREAIQKLLSYRLKFFRDYQSGEILSTIENDINIVQSMIINLSNELLVQIFSIVGLGLVILSMDYQTLLAILTLLLLQTFIQRKFGAIIRKKTATFIKNKGEVYTFSQTLIKKVSEIKMLNIQDYLTNKYQQKQREYFDSEISIVASHSFLMCISVCFQSLALVIVMLIGGYKVLTDILTVGTLFSLTLYVQQFYTSITAVSEVHIKFKKAEASLNRVSELIYKDEYIIEEGQTEKHQFTDSITFADVSYGYDEKLLLKDIDLSIGKYDKVALIGSNGSGKTTLIRLLFKMCDYSGFITVDEDDIRNINSNFIKDNILCISQEPFIFNGTIRENILLGHDHINETELEVILEKVQLLPDVEKMKDGVDTIIGDKGVLLSGGQMQKVALARLFVIKPSIIILDEPTSALDLEAEKAICKNIYEEFADKTIIAITHRDELLNHCTRLLELRDGRIIETRKEKEYGIDWGKSLYKVFTNEG